MNVLIVDDEQLARQRLRHMVGEIGGHRVVGEAETGEQALQNAQNSNPDIVLMDIRMPGMDGLQAANYLSRMQNPPAIIFTTAYSDHALNAFETHAVDYLLKPVKAERLRSALDAAKRVTRAQLDQLLKIERGDQRQKICVKTRGELELIPIDDIIYFKADQKYVTLRTEEREYLIEESLKALENEFGERFTRIHRNALVAESHVSGMTKNPQGHSCIVFDVIDDQLEISRRHLPEVRRRLRSR